MVNADYQYTANVPQEFIDKFLDTYDANHEDLSSYRSVVELASVVRETIPVRCIGFGWVIPVPYCLIAAYIDEYSANQEVLTNYGYLGTLWLIFQIEISEDDKVVEWIAEAVQS